MVVLVTGGSGQLGQSLQFVADKYPQIQFHFLSSSELNIADKENCIARFSELKPDYCINAAAYTAVDKAESETEKAHLINVQGAKNLAETCQEFDATLIHISTDFVFDGNKNTPYTEEDLTNPTSVYGQTKLDGEKEIQAIWEKHFIIRTSWLYSQFANNFMKTMIRLGKEKDALSVVSDQIGTPTNAVDLAEAVVKIIEKTENTKGQTYDLESLYGIYHFSNEGQCSWYDFAKEIFEINGIEIDLKPIPTSSYPTPAKRPGYSVLDKSKIKSNFQLEIKDWKESLNFLFYIK
ncbi:dTDP-4-dehydrorhamnose reductase [uncultured Flavobacterium sp.]|uniref:dTDP-4-dehydrorhamnose reductase n=1 Tax=uncultured Flavobacterium sp. TaxID=165435 RepID=UPI0025F92749|nr:dTDP-4-dehydrorhamnose reductase [uncultured Flavobacterium sp.]